MPDEAVACDFMTGSQFLLFMPVARLLGDASVVLMDEPTNGIDAKDLLARLVRGQQSRRLFFFSIHVQEFITATTARLHRL